MTRQVTRANNVFCGWIDRGFIGTCSKETSGTVFTGARLSVVSKAPEPEARAPLVSTAISAPLELVCIDFWLAEDSSNKSISGGGKISHHSVSPHGERSSREDEPHAGEHDNGLSPKVKGQVSSAAE